MKVVITIFYKRRSFKYLRIRKRPQGHKHCLPYIFIIIFSFPYKVKTLEKKMIQYLGLITS